jgi:hypothetical protein
MNLNRNPEQAILLTKKAEVTYTLHLNQVQLDILHELCTMIGGQGEGRTFTNNLAETLERYAETAEEYLETLYFDINTMIMAKGSK